MFHYNSPAVPDNIWDYPPNLLSNLFYIITCCILFVNNSRLKIIYTNKSDIFIDFLSLFNIFDFELKNFQSLNFV